MAGLKRILSAEGLMALVKALVKLLAVGYVAYRIVLRTAAGAEGLVALAVPDLVVFIGAGVRDTVLCIGAALLVLAAIDYGWEYYRSEQKLRMTRQEVEDEQRATEGDAKIKRRFRKFHYELTKNRMLAEVPTADVVLTNPVHVAVALRYVADVMRAPQVVAKGAGEVAEQIKAAARRAGVPIVERRALARALFRSVKIGQEIPAALYRAVAEVLAYIYSLQRRAQGLRPGAM
jgi:flagellar biosynthetic protein FlhB